MMSSPSHWKALGGDWRKFAEHPSGTGPWIFDSLVPHQRAEMVRNPHYWDPSRVPKLDRLILFPMPEATTRASALLVRSGQLDRGAAARHGAEAEIGGLQRRHQCLSPHVGSTS